MASRNSGGSFVQFQYCQLCRFSHRKKRKHIYSTRHQTIVKNMLDKFFKKITDARSTLDNPEVQHISFENGARFWCHFCVKEVEKHIKMDICVLKYGQLLEHIASEEHKKKMWNFFYEHKVDETKKHPEKFYLRQELLDRFKEKAALNIRRYSSQQEHNICQISKKIKTQEVDRQNTIEEDHGKSQTSQNRIYVSQDPSTDVSNVGFGEKRATLMARGEGLTFIGSHDYGKEEGNVHTGALPPWLQADEDDDNKGKIGPTMETFQKHLANEKKRKLPACRVGAKFDHKSKTADQWLPSFGRVWSKGRRLQSKQYFEKNFVPNNHGNHRGQHSAPSTASSTSSSNMSFTNYNPIKKDNSYTQETNNIEPSAPYKTMEKYIPRQIKPYQKKTNPIQPMGRQHFEMPLLISTPILNSDRTRTKIDMNTANNNFSGSVFNNHVQGIQSTSDKNHAAYSER